MVPAEEVGQLVREGVVLGEQASLPLEKKDVPPVEREAADALSGHRLDEDPQIPGPCIPGSAR